MCGLVGYFQTNQANHQIDILKFTQSIKILHHRGPDAINMWTSNDLRVGLGHTRLAITGVENGMQPIHYQHISAIVNGEFYDYKAIKRALITKGYKFSLDSDSEIIIALYLEYGDQCYRYLNGEFAFILYDSKRNCLIAARDRFGVKPLFYAIYRGTVYIASEIKAILELGVPAKWNLNALWMAENCIPTCRESYFQEICSLEPGYQYNFSINGSVNKKLYWQYQSASYIGSFQDAAVEFRALIEQAVKRRLVADVPVTTYLSGGLDSSIILSLATHLGHQMRETFTISFPESELDEWLFAQEMARYLGVQINKVEVDLQIIADHYAPTVYATESLLRNGQSIAKYYLSKVVRDQGYKVVMTGEGADELFAGYPFFRADIFRDQNDHHNLRELYKNNKKIASAFLPIEEHNDTLKVITDSLNYIPTWWRIGAGYGKHMRTIYNDKMHTIVMQNPFQRLLKMFNITSQTNQSVLNQSLFLWQKTNFSELILSTLGDRVEMANSIEGRLPFLDNDCVNFALAIPDYFKISEIEKKIVREACKDLLPLSIYKREKHPLTAPSAINFTKKRNNPLNDMYSDIIQSSLLDNLPFIDPVKFRKYFTSLKSANGEEQQAADVIVNRIVSAALLHQHFRMRE